MSRFLFSFNHCKFLICLVLIINISCTQRQTKNYAEDTFINKSVYRWQDDFCEYESIFDSTKISRKQIENAINLIDAASIFLFKTKNYYEELIISDIDDLKKQYDSLYNHFHKMSLPDIVPFDSCRKMLLNDLTMTYTGKLAIYKAVLYNDYQPILALSKTDTTVNYYANALSSDNDSILLVAWEHLVNEKAKQQSDSNGYLAKFYEKKGRSDWKKYAKDDLLKYGWWNSYNHTISELDSEAMDALHDKIFIETKTIYCDEP